MKPSASDWWLMARAIRIKEWAQILRDPSTFGVVVVLPLLLMFLFGSAVSLDTTSTRMGIVDLDHTATSRDLVASFASNQHFQIVEGPGVATFRRGLLTEELRAILVIPDGFEAGLVSRKPLDIQLITDGSQPNTATFAAGHTRGLFANWLEARARSQGLSVRPALALLPRFTYNPGLESRFMLMPGAIAIVMAMIGALLTALIMSREYERGTMEGLLATPIPVRSLVMNKLMPYYLLGLASSGLCVAFSVLAYSLPFRGSLLALFLISSAFLTAVLGQGLVISAITKNQLVSTQYAMLSGFLPSMLLSGFLFEIDSMPKPIQWLTYIVPTRYVIAPLQSVFLVGDVWTLFLPNILVLLAMGGLFFYLASASITKNIA